MATTHPLGLLLAHKMVNRVNVSVHTMKTHRESGVTATGTETSSGGGE
jgi:hypothetical protein